MQTLSAYLNHLQSTGTSSLQILDVESAPFAALREQVRDAVRTQSASTVQQHLGDTTGIYPITGKLAFGTDPERKEGMGYRVLRQKGLTHALRLRHHGPQKGWFRSFLFPNIQHLPLSPQWEWSKLDICKVVSALHLLLHCREKVTLLVHCHYGIDRSPTALWLYFQTLGFTPEEASQIIQHVRPDAAPGKAPLVKHQDQVDDATQYIRKKLLGVRSDLFEDLFPVEWPQATR